MRFQNLVILPALLLGLPLPATPASSSLQPDTPREGWRFQVQRSVERKGSVTSAAETSGFHSRIEARWLETITHTRRRQVIRSERHPLALEHQVDGSDQGLPLPEPPVAAQQIEGSWRLYGADGKLLDDQTQIGALGGPPAFTLWPGGVLRQGRRWCLSGDRLENALAPLGIQYASLEMSVERIGREPSTGLQTAYLQGDLYGILPHRGHDTKLRARVELDLPPTLGLALRLDVSGQFEADEPLTGPAEGRRLVRGSYRFRQTLAPSRAVLTALAQPSGQQPQSRPGDGPGRAPGAGDRARATEGLHTAWRYGNMEQIALMLRLGADPDTRGESGCPLLHEALLDEDSGLGWSRAALLMEHDADIDRHCPGKGTPLLLAIDRHLPLESVVSGLLKAGADPDKPSPGGETPLMRALQYSFGQAELVKQLLAAGADINRPAPGGILPHALDADKETLALLLQAGADPGSPSRSGEPILLMAARLWDSALRAAGAPKQADDTSTTRALDTVRAMRLRDSLRLMLKLGADLQAALDAADPASRARQRLLALGLREAVSCGAVAGVRDLLQRGADVHARWDDAGQCSLLDSALLSHGSETELVTLLLQAGAPVEHACHSVGPPLLRAADTAHIQTLAALLQHGAKVNARAGDGSSPLQKALLRNDPRDELAVVRLLLGAGADFQHSDDEGNGVLHQAAYLGSPDTVRALLGAGARIDARDKLGNTPLMTALRMRKRDNVDVLIQAGADLNARDSAGAPLLHAAAGGGDLELVQLLLQAGADPHGRDSFGRTAMHRAAERGRVKVMDHLLRQGADANAVDRDRSSPLLMVAELVDWNYENGDAALEMLLTAGAWVDQQDSSGDSALMKMIRRGHADGARRLMEAGADIHLRNQRQESALLISAGDDDDTGVARDAKRRVMRRLLEAGADPNAQDSAGRTALFLIAESGSHDDDLLNAETLLRFGADPALPNRKGETARSRFGLLRLREWLRGAERLGASRVAAWVLDDLDTVRAQADLLVTQRRMPDWQVDARDAEGRTRLMRAARAGYPAAMRYYLERGAAVDESDKRGMTPLMLAALGGRGPAVTMLLRQGARPAVQMENGFSALLLAAIAGASESVQALLDHGVPVDEKAADGHTALWYAAQNGHPEVARLLLERGAAVDAADTDGWTALMAATMEQDLDMARLLVERGADPRAKTVQGISAEIIAGHKKYQELTDLFASAR